MKRSKPIELNPVIRRFVEDAGNTTQSFGIGRVVGQIYAYLYFSPEPRSLADMQASLSKTFAFGTEVSVGLGTAWQEQGTSKNVASGVSLDVTQPLLRGFGRDATEGNLIIARTNLASAESALRDEIAAALQAVESSYWDLVEARLALEVAKLSLEQSEQLLERSRARVEKERTFDGRSAERAVAFHTSARSPSVIGVSTRKCTSPRPGMGFEDDRFGRRKRRRNGRGSTRAREAAQAARHAPWRRAPDSRCRPWAEQTGGGRWVLGEAPKGHECNDTHQS